MAADAKGSKANDLRKVFLFIALKLPVFELNEYEFHLFKAVPHTIHPAEVEKSRIKSG
jgi:hypothetical protein